MLRVLMSIGWLLASIALSVFCFLAGHWVFKLIAVFCIISAVVSGYIVREEVKYL